MEESKHAGKQASRIDIRKAGRLEKKKIGKYPHRKKRTQRRFSDKCKQGVGYRGSSRQLEKAKVVKPLINLMLGGKVRFAENGAEKETNLEIGQ